MSNTMTKEAVKIWSEDPGQEATRPELPPSLDITEKQHQNEAFRAKFLRREDYDYESKGQQRHGVSYVCELQLTSSKEAKNLEGKTIGIYGRGLLNYQMKQLGMKEGDVFVVSCTGQDKVGDTTPYQFTLKKVTGKK